ncbi:MAG: hypothetical protein M1820_009677 [Bogoriella megaspora]|nr:MAG: hypothetical protein M1820_009677 [Bogoriella megaspora]
MALNSTKPEVLITCLPGYGHVEKMRAIAAGLIARGYSVTFITASVYRKGIESTGAYFVPLKSEADLDMDRLDETHPEFWNMPQGRERHEYAFRTFVIGPVKDSHLTVQEQLARYKDQSKNQVVVLQDTGFLGNAPILLGAPGLRVPVIGIGTARLAMKSIDTPPFNSGLPPDSSAEGRKRNAALQEEVEAKFATLQSGYQDILRSLGVSSSIEILFYMDSQVVLADRFLQMSIPSIEYPRSDLPSNIRFIGALPTTGGRKASKSLGAVSEAEHLPSWWDEVIAHTRPLIVVSQGSKSTNPEELILPTLRALTDLDVLVVATLVTVKPLPNDFDIPSNVRTASFVPFHELFKHTDIAITNGGYGAVQQALYLGVPMILAGEGKDHTATNARVAWSGAAINLAKEFPEPERVRKAVVEMLGGGCRYRKRAKELAEEYKSMGDPMDKIVETIEELGSESIKLQSQ